MKPGEFVGESITSLLWSEGKVPCQHGAYSRGFSKSMIELLLKSARHIKVDVICFLPYMKPRLYMHILTLRYKIRERLLGNM